MQELKDLLAASRADELFKTDVLGFHEAGQAERIEVRGFIPHVKVARLLKQVLHTEPELPIERVRMRGASGCSDFEGVVELHTSTGTHVYEFHWDCRWRAESEGWTDCFGFPDQIRAAREYDWRCFRVWAKTASN